MTAAEAIVQMEAELAQIQQSGGLSAFNRSTQMDAAAARVCTSRWQASIIYRRAKLTAIKAYLYAAGWCDRFVNRRSVNRDKLTALLVVTAKQLTSSLQQSSTNLFVNSVGHARSAVKRLCVACGMISGRLKQTHVVKTVNPPKIQEQHDRDRLDEIAALLLVLTYAEMVELADAICQAQPEGSSIPQQTLAAILYRWSKTRAAAVSDVF